MFTYKQLLFKYNKQMSIHSTSISTSFTRYLFTCVSADYEG